MLGKDWTRDVVWTTVGLALVAALLAGCGDDGGSGVDAGASTDPSASAPSLRTEGSATADPSASAPVGECAPPTSDVTYATGSAVLSVGNGPYAGDHQLTIDADRPQDNAYVTGFGEQLVGNWQGAGLADVENMPKLEVRMLNEGDICQGPPIVRIYLPYLAHEDNDSVACTASLDSLSTTGAAGRFECTGMPRTFGTAEPETLDASGTFTLGS